MATVTRSHNHNYYIKIAARPVGKPYKHSHIMAWPKLFDSAELAEAFLTNVFSFKHMSERFPRNNWRLSASVEYVRVRK